MNEHAEMLILLRLPDSLNTSPAPMVTSGLKKSSSDTTIKVAAWTGEYLLAKLRQQITYYEQSTGVYEFMSSSTYSRILVLSLQ